MREKPRVVIHQDELGEFSVFSDEGVTVFWIDERVPNDRVYQFSQYPVPEGMLTGAVGRYKDGSSADAKAHAYAAWRDGELHLSAVTSDPEG